MFYCTEFKLFNLHISLGFKNNILVIHIHTESAHTYTNKHKYFKSIQYLFTKLISTVNNTSTGLIFFSLWAT